MVVLVQVVLMAQVVPQGQVELVVLMGLMVHQVLRGLTEQMVHQVQVVLMGVQGLVVLRGLAEQMVLREQAELRVLMAHREQAELTVQVELQVQVV